MALTANKRRELAVTLPECQARVVHSFADGWTVRKLVTKGDEHREGVLMSHCWRYAAEHWQRECDSVEEFLALPIDGYCDTIHSLRDQDNLPRLSFYLWNEGHNDVDRWVLRYVLGPHNSDPKDELLLRLYQWALTLPFPVSHEDEYLVGDDGSYPHGEVTVNEALVAEYERGGAAA